MDQLAGVAAKLQSQTQDHDRDPAHRRRRRAGHCIFLQTTNPRKAMIKKILVGFIAVIAILCVIIATRPDTFRVERSATIAASPAALFEQVNDSRKFEAWNPWQKIDPNIKNTYSGPPAGVGASCSWVGNNEVGEGTSTIIESKPGELVRMKMEFRKPMAGVSTVDFTFKPEGDKTVVTWSMYGPQPFIGKAMSLVMDCDKMCGDQFEKGLANLAAVVATPAKP
jgi:uncharacterized protein YndB with AHSA1/START domain